MAQLIRSRVERASGSMESASPAMAIRDKRLASAHLSTKSDESQSPAALRHRTHRPSTRRTRIIREVRTRDLQLSKPARQSSDYGADPGRLSAPHRLPSAPE